jgi:hypothetical protein
MKYQVLAKYNKNEDFGEWQVGTFARISDANEYMARTKSRYVNEYGYKEFEMKAQKISDETANSFNEMLVGLCD